MERVPEDHLFYYSPQTDPADYAFLPCVSYLLDGPVRKCPRWSPTSSRRLAAR